MEIEKKTLWRIFLGAAGCVVLYWLLHETERLTAFVTGVGRLFSPFIVGAAIAFVLNVPLRGFENLLRGVKKPGLRRTLALLLTVLAFLLVIFAVVQLLLPQITATVSALAAKLPDFFRRVAGYVQDFLRDNPNLTQWLRQNTDLEKVNWAALVQQAASFAGDSLTKLFSQAFTAVGTVTGVVVNLFISLVFSVYCLFRKEILARQGRRLLYAFFPEAFCDGTVRILRMTNATFSNFLSGQCLEACILGCLFAVSMAIFRMPYIPLVSVLVAVTALVPVVGAFVGCIVGAFFILVDDPILAIWFVVMFLVLQQIENNMIYPRVVGTSIGLPGMWVLLAVTVGGELMGIGGMLLMIPLMSVLYALLREITDSRLKKRQIPDEKLQDQPPELRSRLREKAGSGRFRQLLDKWFSKKGK